MKIRKISLITFVFTMLSCYKNKDELFLINIKLPKSSVLGFSNKIGIVIKDYSLLKSKLNKEKKANINQYDTIIKKGTILKIEKMADKDKKIGLKGQWILIKYKGEKKYIFSKDIKIIDSITIE